jgi:hypothetical protein
MWRSHAKREAERSGTREVRLFIERDWLFLVAEIVIENETLA